MNPLVSYTLRLGDDALILSQRLAEWVSRAPQLEEDVALANIALDLLGQARNLLTYAGEVEGAGRGEDELAYFRDEREFLNCQLVELDNGDFAVSTARQLVFSAYQYELYSRLSASVDPTLAAIAAKAIKEVAYHRDHATQWVLRLGDGTAESRSRMIDGLAQVRPYVGELFETDQLEQQLVESGVAVDSSSLRDPWDAHVLPVLRQATLDGAGEPAYSAFGGRQGVHTEAMGHLLAQMQHLARSHPGARW